MTSLAHDVIILGGGLAGLTLAIQLRQRFADLNILVLERKNHPLPEAAHKVGESTVEIGAHYLSKVLGLDEHLKTRQLRKYGLRFFFSEGRHDVDQVLELGSSRYFSVPGYQLDRGIFENHLGEYARTLGVTFMDGAVVRSFDLAKDGLSHQVCYEVAGQQQHVQTRWIVDATGRAGLIKRKLDLAQENAHDANAVWFRIGTRIDMNEWSSDPAWLNRNDPPHRWLSTIHLVGEGYWVWLIPLSSGSHSVGIVCDAKLHPLQSMNTFEKALVWLHKYQPRLGQEVQAKRHLLQDFLFLRNFSYDCKQVFSGDRWALTGEAGVFLDPLYSPGSDFIGISNTYITDLIARERAGEEIRSRAGIYQRLYFSFCESTLSLYTDQYPIFGDAEVTPIKVIWDYAYYWGVLTQLFFQQRLTDLISLGRLSTEFTHSRDLNLAIQKLLREWARVNPKHNHAVFLDQSKLRWFWDLNKGLNDELDDTTFRQRIRDNTLMLDELAHQVVDKALQRCPQLDVSEVSKLLEGGKRLEIGPLLFDAAA
jgi:flavin-dependent dehydrogenase